MPDPANPILSHFSLFRFTDRFWSTASKEREAFHRDWVTGLQQAADTKFYQVYPIDTNADVLLWSSTRTNQPCDTSKFFRQFAEATTPFRGLVETTATLWGFTRPSQYSTARSKQEIEPLSDDRKQYLIVYPFVKTSEWYLMGQESRQGMMNEHIKVGKQYTEIKQLLLYSFGLQNQEFVVVYETDDLMLFSDLVKELRSTEGRKYTERDTPLHTATYYPGAEALELFK